MIIRPIAFSEVVAAGHALDSQRALPRFLIGLSLSAVFGLGLGLRFGPTAMAVHALAVPLAQLAVAGLGGPAFYIGLVHGGLELDARVLAAALARGSAVTGLVLAGLAPAMALLGVSCEDLLAVQGSAALALAAAGLIGLRALLRSLPAAPGTSLIAPKLCFVAFAALLSARVWLSVLPVFGGAR